MKALLVVGLFLALATPAGAAHWSVKDTDTAIAVADAHWPGSRCQGIERIDWVTTIPGPDVVGYAEPATCQVEINWQAILTTAPTPDYLCTIIEHEFGHLAGYEHSTNPLDVMYPTVVMPAHDCAKAFPAKTVCHYLPKYALVKMRPLVERTCEPKSP